jgi:hypothetical protein
LRHAGHDAWIEQQTPAGLLANVDELGPASILLAAPTEPEVTNVTSTSTSMILIGDDQGVLTRMLQEPPTRLVVDPYGERLSL